MEHNSLIIDEVCMSLDLLEHYLVQISQKVKVMLEGSPRLAVICQKCIQFSDFGPRLTITLATEDH